MNGELDWRQEPHELGFVLLEVLEGKRRRMFECHAQFFNFQSQWLWVFLWHLLLIWGSTAFITNQCRIWPISSQLFWDF